MALDYLFHLHRESNRFLEVMARADPARRVPSCPGWKAADLLWHLAEVQWFWGTIVAERRSSPDGMSPPQRPGGHEDLLGFAHEQAARLHAVLGEATPDTPAWMWAEDRTVGYIRRRQAHEALIHRLDAELTAGEVTPLDAELASDGVLEALEVMYGGIPSTWGAFRPTSSLLRVEALDTGLAVPLVIGRFTGTDPEDGAAYDEDVVDVRRGDADAAPSATVRGRAEDLDAWLWGRRSASMLAWSGDRGLGDRFAEVVARGIQ